MSIMRGRYLDSGSRFMDTIGHSFNDRHVLDQTIKIYLLPSTIMDCSALFQGYSEYAITHGRARCRKLRHLHLCLARLAQFCGLSTNFWTALAITIFVKSDNSQIPPRCRPREGMCLLKSSRCRITATGGNMGKGRKADKNAVAVPLATS